MEEYKALFCSPKFPSGRRKNFFEIYKKFGHADTEIKASPVLDEAFCRQPNLLQGEPYWQPIA
jgi:hypothetical protein